jgi:hypothetical protein
MMRQVPRMKLTKPRVSPIAWTLNIIIGVLFASLLIMSASLVSKANCGRNPIVEAKQLVAAFMPYLYDNRNWGPAGQGLKHPLKSVNLGVFSSLPDIMMLDND